MFTYWNLKITTWRTAQPPAELHNGLQNYTTFCIARQPPAELHSRMQNYTTTCRIVQPPAELHNRPQNYTMFCKLHNHSQNHTTACRATQQPVELHNHLQNYTTTCRSTHWFPLSWFLTTLQSITKLDFLSVQDDKTSNYKTQLYSIICTFNVHLFLRNVHYRLFGSALSPQRCLQFPFVRSFILFLSTIPQH